MINNRFEELVQVLYRLDVDEKKLKILLSESEDKNAADIISSLIIERQLQKLNTQKQQNPNQNIAEDERWWIFLSASLETAFIPRKKISVLIEDALNYFFGYFFSLDDVPPRTKKHIAAPFKGSTCKRLNMFLRWMVRSDRKKVDFGIWKMIKPADLICPVDLHVARVARKLKLIERKQTDWLTAVELTQNLKKLDAKDPVKYDFALFSLGIGEKI